MKKVNLKGASLKKFRGLSIANMIIAWLFFICIIGLCYILIQSEIRTKGKFFYYENLYRIIIFSVALTFFSVCIGLSAAQSVMAKRLQKISQCIGYEQVICILIMLIGFALIIGLIGVGFMFLLPNRGSSQDPTVILHEHMVIQFSIGCYLLTSLLVGGYAIYNSVLCAKAK